MAAAKFDVLCEKHKTACLLKTGMSSGPNYLKSFYMCPQNCGFIQKTSTEPKLCLVHADQYVELQARLLSRSSRSYRVYFRCCLGRTEGKNWCGNIADPESPADDMGLKSQAGAAENLQCRNNDGSVLTDLVHVLSDGPSSAAHSLTITSDKNCTKRSELVKSSNCVDSVVGPCPLSFSDVARAASSTTASQINDSSVYRDQSAILVSDDDDDDDDDDKTDGDHDADDKVHFSQTTAIDLQPNVDKKQTSEIAENEAMPKSIPVSKSLSSNSRVSASIMCQSSSVTTAFCPRPSSVQPLSSVSSTDVEKLVAKRENVSRLLSQKRSVMKSVKLDALPDGGRKLCDEIQLLTDKLQQLNTEISQCYMPLTVVASSTSEVGQQGLAVVTKSCSAHQPFKPPRPATSGSAGVTHVKCDIVVQRGACVQTTNSTATPSTVVSTPLRQLKLTDCQSLSAHVQQQLYLSDNQREALYGGRMTSSRLFHVGQVTSEAVELLHRQFESCPDAEVETSDPDCLTVPLMTHQRQALTWLTWRENQKPSGGILADDMGLGKTLTMIALLLKQRAQHCKTHKSGIKLAESSWMSAGETVQLNSSATLVICPASLVHQWNNEIERRVRPRTLDVVLYHGPNRVNSATRLAEADIVLTTYNIVSREVHIPDQLKDKRAVDMPATDATPDNGSTGDALSMVRWRRIIIDEGHIIKNHKSLTAQCVCRLTAESRWVLTGTPIHNNLLDMYALLRFLRCSPFDELKVWKRQVDNRTDAGQLRLNTLVKSLLLRRTKDQTSTCTGKPLVSLPVKSNVTHEVWLSVEEQQVYDRLYRESRATVLDYLRAHDEKMLEKLGLDVNHRSLMNPWAGDDDMFNHRVGHGSYQAPSGIAGSLMKSKSRGAGTTTTSRSSGGQILIYLLRLRQCCSHLSILRDAVDVDVLQAEGLDLDLVDQMKDLSVVADDDDTPGTKANVLAAFDPITPSTKITELVSMLKEIRSKSSKSTPEKSVVVSQWVTMLNVVNRHLVAEGFKTCTIRGDVPVKLRSQTVDAFNTDMHGPSVMLVSLRAGGVGLNLVGGNHLFLLDMHWNPALEQQACDRVYRVGQKRDVFIHRFVCKDTVEEKILALQERKTALAANVLSGAGSASEKLSLNDLKMLFGLEQCDSSLKPALSGFYHS